MNKQGAVGKRFYLVVMFILTCIVFNQCTMISDNSGKSVNTNSNHIVQQDTLEKKASIDTAFIISDIKKRYNFIIKNRNTAKIETSESHENHQDSGADGEYSENNFYDTTFIVNDSLIFNKKVTQGNNHFMSYNNIVETFYYKDKMFFKFSQDFEYLYFDQKSAITENRYYYFKDELIRCLERNLTIDYNIDFSDALDSISKIESRSCLKKK